MRGRRGQAGGDIAREQDEALAALLKPGRGAAEVRMTPGGTVLHPGTASGTFRAKLRSAASVAVPAAPAWLPYAGLVGGSAIGVGCILFGLLIAPLLAHAIWRAGDAAPAWPDALFTVTIFGPMLLLTLIAGRLTGVRTVPAGEASLAMLGLGALVGGCGIGLAASYAALVGVAHVASPGQGGLLVLAGSALMLLQSGTEEVLLRGWMQPAIASRWSPWAAILLTALIFAGLHVLGGARSPVSLINLTIGGVMFGLLRWRTGGLVAPLAAHFAWNWTEAYLLGLDPNPGIGNFGALFDLDMVGPAIWGGSEEGLNASLAMMVVLIAIVLPLAFWRRDRAHV